MRVVVVVNICPHVTDSWWHETEDELHCFMYISSRFSFIRPITQKKMNRICNCIFQVQEIYPRLVLMDSLLLIFDNLPYHSKPPCLMTKGGEVAWFERAKIGYVDFTIDKKEYDAWRYAQDAHLRAIREGGKYAHVKLDFPRMPMRYDRNGYALQPGELDGGDDMRSVSARYQRMGQPYKLRWSSRKEYRVVFQEVGERTRYLDFKRELIDLLEEFFSRDVCGIIEEYVQFHPAWPALLVTKIELCDDCRYFKDKFPKRDML